MRTNARVLKVNLDAAKNRAESVTYIDASGREFEQPGGLVILAAYALGNVHLMLWSGIGRPYDPVTGEGVVGRNYAYQIGSGQAAQMASPGPLPTAVAPFSQSASQRSVARAWRIALPA